MIRDSFGSPARRGCIQCEMIRRFKKDKISADRGRIAKMDERISIFAFAGSLRKNSYNKALLRAAVELAPEDAAILIFDLEGIPPFNQDLEQQPEDKVKEFKAGIRAADSILIATPEYKYSIPGVLKNAIDWGSRPFGDNAFDGKPIALMGASIGQLGTARAQYHLRQVLVTLNMYPLNRPEVLVSLAQTKIDEAGMVTDGDTRKLIGRLLERLIAWTRKLKSP
jgi:chromate reductase